MDDSKPWFATPIGMPIYLAIRALAVVDAVVVPAAIMWWFARQPLRGGPFGITAAVLMSIWALKRASKAIFDIGEYDWMVLKFGAVGLWALFIMAVVHVWQWASRLAA